MVEQAFQGRWRPILFLGISILLIAVIGVIDYLTGTELRVYPFYFIPLSLGGWHVGRWGSVLLSALCATGWGLSNHLAGLTYSHPLTWLVNIFMQWVAFTTVALLIAVLRRRVDQETLVARLDTLTLLPNTRAFYERAEAELARARRHGHPLTAAYLDLDNFKAVNDRFGHHTGDELLCLVGETLRKSTRSSDIVARLGGDEFVLLLPETGPENGRSLLERILSLLAQKMRARQWPVTVSIGAISFVRPPQSVYELVSRADAVMYSAKRAGKDTLHLEVAETTREPASYSS